MPGLRTLVVAVDLSPASAPAVARAADLAERTGATLHVLFAHLLFRDEGTLGGRAEGVLRLRLERFVADALSIPRSELDVLGPVVAVERGLSAQDAICAYAEREGADLLVLGTHGRTGIGRLLLGSVAEACVNRAPCPVLTVSASAGQIAPSPEAPILLPVDFTPRTEAALQVARGLAGLYGAPIEALHIVRDAGPYPDLVPEVISVSDVDPEADAVVRERLAGLGPDIAETHVVFGTPARAIARLAHERNAGMVVLATHARRGIERLAMGSVAEATLRRSPCPVLTLTVADLARPARSPARPARALAS